MEDKTNKNLNGSEIKASVYSDIETQRTTVVNSLDFILALNILNLLAKKLATQREQLEQKKKSPLEVCSL